MKKISELIKIFYACLPPLVGVYIEIDATLIKNR